MKPALDSNNPVHIGINCGVLFIRDLGYVFLDDGERLLRLGEDDFDSIMAATSHEEYTTLLERYPSIFTLYTEPASASASLTVQELKIDSCWHRLSAIW